MGIHKHKFEKGVLAPAPVGLDQGLDTRFPCRPDERPTDEEAKENGFEDANQWYAHSAGGVLVHPRVLKHNFQELPDPSPQDPEEGFDRCDLCLPIPLAQLGELLQRASGKHCERGGERAHRDAMRSCRELQTLR